MSEKQTSLTNGLDDIQVQKLSHAVADRLRNQIITGQRKPGDRLPGEAELIEQFKVSRPTIREALRILEVESLIVLGRGARSGATVQEPSTERAAEYAAMVLVRGETTMAELHEVRALLEPSMIGQLVRDYDSEVINQLQIHIDTAKECMAESRIEDAIEAFNGFHASLASGSKNRALNLIVDMLRILSLGVTSALIEKNSATNTEMSERIMVVIAAYDKLLKTVRARKADEAENLWRKYMTAGTTNLERTGLGKKKLVYRSPR